MSIYKITQKELKEVLNYNEDTGLFKYIKSSNSKIKIGQIAGTISNGYCRIKINGKSYLGHHLVWLYKYSSFPEYPKYQIDHINQNRLDNRLSNLRIVTQSCNQRNAKKRKDNTSGVTGVIYANKGWVTRINDKKGKIYLGKFKEFSEAVSARKRAELVLKYSENHGR